MSLHDSLKTTEELLRKSACGMPEAPPPPSCLTPEQTAAIHQDLIALYDVDEGLAKTQGSWHSRPHPLVALYEDARRVLYDIVDLLPKTPEQQQMLAKLKRRR